ncbi:PAS domain S-box protein [Schlegelella aquatica]|uniref:PAS domain S-box protein n=1 Tax=Caldimonas aquatica TaxID=376175 RepID=UPI0037522299
MSTAAPDAVADRPDLLRELRILDTSREPCLDSAVALAQQLTGFPLAWLALVDGDRMWLKASVGLRRQELPCAGGWCTPVLTSPGPLAVESLRAYDVTPHTAAIWEAEGVDGYAAVPIRVEGQALGLLAVADHVPRLAPATALAGLEHVARLVGELLEGRLKAQRSRLQEARVRTASRAGSDWLWETDAEGRVTWASETIATHIGLRPQEEIGRKPSEILLRRQDPEHDASWQAYLAARARREPFHNLVADRITPRGRVTVSISGIPVFDSTGRFRGYRGATRIITHELEAQARARHAQQLLQHAIESMSASVAITDERGLVVHANRTWRDRNGRYLDPANPSWEAALRRMVEAGEFPDAVGREAEFLAQWAAAEHQATPREVRRRDQWLLVTSQRLEHGGAIHVGVDITARKQSELELAYRQAELRASEARMAAVLQALPDLWFVMDAQGRYLRCGDTARHLLAAPFEQVMGRSVHEVLPSDTAQRIEAALRAALDTGAVQRVEYELTPMGSERVRTFEGRFVRMTHDQVLLIVRDLTELRSMERDLHIMLRAIEAEASLPISVVDAEAPDQPLVYVNPAFERLTGYSREEVLGRNCRILQGLDRDQGALEPLRAALRQGRSTTVVLRNYRKDGTRFINEVHVAPVHAADGRITHFIGVQTDITERSVAADRLRLSEELYRSVALSISDGLMVVTTGSYVVAVNPAACRILDMAMEDLLMSPGLELLDESLEPLPAEDHPVTRTLESGEPTTERVYGVKLSDGRVRWLHLGVQPLRIAPHDRPLSAVVTFRDITRQREAEQALAVSEQRWKFALEGSGNGVWDWDVASDRVFYSTRWKEILGYLDHELGSSVEVWSSRVHPDDRAAVLERLQAHLRGESAVYQSEHRIRHREGHHLWVSERGKAVLRDTDGRALRIVGTLADITPQKEAEQALRDKQAAELASRSKTEFLSRMSHEMRTPLNAMIGFSQLLKLGARGPGAEQVRDYADHMLQAGQHLLALINDVLDLQRVEAGQLPMTPGAVSLRHSLTQVIDLLKPAAESALVHFRLEVPAAVHVWADAQRLRQVLINIVSNAVKYNRPGGDVTLTLERPREVPARGERVVLRVEDNGEGLDAGQLARLFQPFERLGRETSSIEGTGLGLVIAKRLLQEMEGSIAVTSTPGQGTQVRIELPAASAQTQLEPPARPSGEVVAELGAPRPLRMLYVEDNPINALLFEEAMKLAGHVELRIAEDGPRALDIVREWLPDILVLDAHLPGMDGIQVLKALRNHQGLAEAPAFMCSADAMPEDIQRALDAGFQGYWTKPIEVSRVLAEVRRIAARSSLPQSSL